MQRKEALLALCDRIEARVAEIRSMLERPTTREQLNVEPALVGSDPESTDRHNIHMALGEIVFFVLKELRDPYWETQ